MSDRMKLYLSGPVLGIPYEDAKKEFSIAQGIMERRGFEVVNPLKLCDTDMPRSSCMRIDLRELTRCDGLVLLYGWEGSRGARLERDIALECGLVVGELSQWHSIRVESEDSDE